MIRTIRVLTGPTLICAHIILAAPTQGQQERPMKGQRQPTGLRACVLQLLLLAAPVRTFIVRPTGVPTAGPSYSGPKGAAQTQLHAIQVKRVTDLIETQAVTAFFVDNFWPEPITKPQQKQQLQSEVYRDLSKRYVQVDNSKLYKACLLVAREAGRIVGCVGIESRTMVNGKLAAPGVIEDMRAPGVSIRPVIANLAVDRSIRRRGVGKKLLEECDKVVAGWSQPELYLVVDEKNTAARRLYESQAYETVYKDPRGTKVVPTEWQLRELPVTNLCMRKAVKKPAASSFSLFGLFGK